MFKNFLIGVGRVCRALAPMALVLLSVASLVLAGLLWLFMLAMRLRNALVVAAVKRLIRR